MPALFPQNGLFATEGFVAQTYGTMPGTEDGVRLYGGFYGGGGKLFAAQVRAGQRQAELAACLQALLSRAMCRRQATVP